MKKKDILKINYFFNVDNYLNINIFNKNISIKENVNKFISDICLLYGSSYDGRKKFSKRILKSTAKLPIVLSENNKIIIFPLFSSRNKNQIWINFNNINDYYTLENDIIIEFIDGEKYKISIEINNFDNILYKCSKIYTYISLKM